MTAVFSQLRRQWITGSLTFTAIHPNLRPQSAPELSGYKYLSRPLSTFYPFSPLTPLYASRTFCTSHVAPCTLIEYRGDFVSTKWTRQKILLFTLLSGATTTESRTESRFKSSECKREAVRRKKWRQSAKEKADQSKGETGPPWSNAELQITGVPRYDEFSKFIVQV